MNLLTPTFILEFVFGLVMLIIIHEFGHFIVSRLLKVEVEEFGLGFPPRAARLFTWKGTLFSLNWIPLGGFVRPKGENDPTIEGGLAAANPWVRLAVYFAGPVMNLLVGAFLFTLVFAQLGTIPDMHTVQLAEVQEGSPAALAGLLPGDTIKTADGEKISSMEDLRSVIMSNLGETFNMVAIRNGETIIIAVTPRTDPAPGQGALGIVMTNPEQPFTLANGISAGFNQISEYVRAMGDLMGKLFRGQANSQEVGLVGIVGMGDYYVEMRQAEPAPGIPRSTGSLAFFATISVSLGLLNLLPIPALDGGRILLTLPELITGRRVPPRYENWLNGASFVLLIFLLLYVNARDVFNLLAK